MSKVAESKKRQGYRTKPNTCSNCAHFTSEKVLPAFCAERNDLSVLAGFPRPYSVEQFGVDVNKRCSLGGFAVNKSATCNEHQRKEPT
jgi:hypothetical protein